MDDRSAILNFVGQMYGQMKEIDSNIAAAGSNAKFGGRSAEIKKVFEEVAVNLQPPVPITTEIPAVHQPALVTASVPTAAPVIVQPTVAHQSQEEQLELKFSSTDKDVLNSIYNVLFDIRKILTEAVVLQKQQMQTPVVKKERKQSSLVSCCLCGANAKGKKVSEKLYTVACEGCKNSESGLNESLAKVAWNNKNKQL
jgi:hypothetical protein